MSTLALKTAELLDKLDEASQISVFKFAEYLAAKIEEDAADVAAFDEAFENDDGYRISHEDLRAKYGI